MVLIVAKPPSLLTGLGEMSATMVTPGMVLNVSRMAAKRGARNSMLSCDRMTTFALPPSLSLMYAAAASASTFPVSYCGALSSEVAGGGTMVPT